MKRISILLLICLLTTIQASAVLKEKDLGRTLGVLCLELRRTYSEQQVRLGKYKAMSEAQHMQLVEYMERSEQIGLMLYSQNNDFTFDLAYACQEATDLYNELSKRNLPYEKINQRVETEICRYDSLMSSLEALPPFVGRHKLHLTHEDSVRLANDTALQKRISLFLLSDEEQKYRMLCLAYAKQLRDNLIGLQQSIAKDKRHYDRATRKAKELYDYAQAKYKDLQSNIFVNGGDSYPTILAQLPRYIKRTQIDFRYKYMPLTQSPFYSEWRGPIVLGVSIFILFYILLATILSYLIVNTIPKFVKRFFPKTHEKIEKRIHDKVIKGEDLELKRRTLIIALGLLLFIIAVMFAMQFLRHNMFLMAAELMITIAWLFETIFFSLLIRLNGNHIKKAVNLYLPFIFMSFTVILFRIVLIPNNLVSLVCPPLLLCFIIWQVKAIKKNKDGVPMSDTIFVIISLATMIAGLVFSWFGYTLLAVQVMIWWIFQLSSILTVNCLYHLMDSYEMRFLTKKISTTLKDKNEKKSLVKRMKTGEFINKTWLYDFVKKTIVPILAVLSILWSITWAASIFEMTSACKDIFFYNFIDQEGVIQLSLFKLCLVFGCYFFFRYLNYAIRSFYHIYFKKTKKENAEYNETLVRNIIAILVWGSYFIFALILLKVPKSGIEIVTAGLATGMGFAMKDLLENFFYGISLMTGRVRVGDYIECDDVLGKVESITYQSTQVVTEDGSVIAFLNSALFNKNFKNLTRNHSYVMIKIPVGIAYGSNVNEVRNMLLKEIEPLCEEKFNGRRVTSPNRKVAVIFNDFGDNSVDLYVVVWVLVEQKILFICRIKELIYNTLNKHNIEIPFPQRDVYIRKIESGNNDII